MRVAQIVAGSVVRGGTAGLEPRLKPTTRGGFARLGQRILVGRRAIETEGREVGGGAIVGVDGRDRRYGKDITDRVHLPSPEERSEDAVRRSRLRQDVCRFVDEQPSLGTEPNTFVGQSLGDQAIATSPVWRVVAADHDGVGFHFRREPRNHRRGIADPDEQTPAARLDLPA